MKVFKHYALLAVLWFTALQTSAQPRISIFFDHVAEIARQEHLSIREAAEKVKQLGVEGIDVRVTMSDAQLSMLDSLGFRHASAIADINFVKGEQPEAVRQALDFMRRHRYSRLLVIPGLLPENATPELMNEVAGRIADFVRMARRGRIDIMVEDYDNPRSPCYNTQTLDQLFQASPQLSHVFDTGNYLFCGEDVMTTLRHFKDKIHHVHLKDRKAPRDYASLPIGTGVVPLKEVIRELLRDGYDGWFTVEHFGAPAMLEYTTKSVANIQAVWKEYISEMQHSSSIRSGEIWPDENGQHINAHGGGILKYGDTYYWFGEHKSDRTSDALVGVTCYASKDLLHWRNCGVALSVTDEQGHDIERGCILERPKVIYNKVTKKFCMWFHLELKGRGYDAARYGVAVADKPEGPYQFLYSQRANANTWPVEFDKQALAIVDTLNAANFQESWTPAWRQAVAEGLFVKRDFSTGQMSRDMTLYVDDDGHAYHIFSSEENLTLHIAELTDDYLHHSGRYTRVAPAGHNEAPAIFKHDGTYWMITSGCTGWAPNEARMFSAPSIWGPWTQHPNPCRGPRAEITFGGQSTFILKVNQEGDNSEKIIFMADIWRPHHPSDARYIWLPIEFEDGKPVVHWRNEWTVFE